MEIGIALAFIIGCLLLLRRNVVYSLPSAVVYLLAVVYLTFLIREPAPLLKYSLKLFRAARKGLEFGGGVIPGLLSGTVKIKKPETKET